MIRNRWNVIDIFSGCGGATEGLKQGGFQILAAIDNDPIACMTYRMNHTDVTLYEDDVRKIDPQKIKKNHLKDKELDVMLVCAPCQPFSSQNKNRKYDRRASLILQATRFSKVLKPKIILFENVSGVATEKHKTVLKKLKRGLQRNGYSLGDPIEVDAADYGVPQRRKRCILIAVAGLPLPSLPRVLTPLGKRVTVRDVIGCLKALKSGEKDSEDVLHFARNHSQIALKRLKKIPRNGGSRISLPDSLSLKCHKNYSGHPDVYGRMKWNEVAPTLTTGCTDVTKGRFAHPRDDRAITLREAAFLQTFPPNYIFMGSPNQISTQIGNAVPVKLFKSFGPMIRKTLKNAVQST